MDLQIIHQRLLFFDVFNSALKLVGGVMIKGRAYPITVFPSAGNAPGGPLCHMAGETTLSRWKLTQMLLTGGPLQLGLTA